MKTRIGLYSILLVTLLTTIGCNKGSKRPEITARLMRGQSVYMNIVDDNIGLLNVNRTGYWGDITGYINLSPEDFNSQWRGLMAATLQQNDIGMVSSYAGTSQGVKFQGGVRATFAGGMISNVDLATAQLRIAIWDDKAGKTDASGKIIPEYPIHMIGATGMAAGNSVNLTFTDSYGTISMSGVITGGLFQGQFSFNNLVNLSGGALPQSGPLGSFTINVCDFFVCN